MLFNCGANINGLNYGEKTALWWAIKLQRSVDLVKFLLDYEALVDDEALIGA